MGEEWDGIRRREEWRAGWYDVWVVSRSESCVEVRIEHVLRNEGMGGLRLFRGTFVAYHDVVHGNFPTSPRRV